MNHPLEAGRREHDGADFFRDRAERVSGLDDGCAFEIGGRFVLLRHVQLLAF